MAARIVASTFAVASPASPVRLSGVVYLSLASNFCPMTRRVSRSGSRPPWPIGKIVLNVEI
jgi:hypothetical protein